MLLLINSFTYLFTYSTESRDNHATGNAETPTSSFVIRVVFVDSACVICLELLVVSWKMLSHAIIGEFWKLNLRLY